MKTKFLLGIPCAAIAIASVIGVSQFDSENLAGNDLLMENVEALALDEIKPSKACSTEKQYINYLTKCPFCQTNFGRQGTSYSCVGNGNSSTCKEGFEGTEIYCNCQHRPAMPINNVQIYSCD